MLCCNFCNVVFHLSCLRPKLREPPEGDWQCPYCVEDEKFLALPEAERATVMSAAVDEKPKSATTVA